MTKDELIKKLDVAFERCNIADPEKFGGSVAEYEFANGKADAYSDAIHWVKLYFEAQSK